MEASGAEREEVQTTAGSEWRNHAVVFAAALGGFADLYCTQAIFPELQARYQVTAATAGSLVTTTTLVLAATAPFTQHLARWLRGKTALLVGLAGLTACTAALGLVTSIEQVIALRVLQGLFIPVVLSALLASNRTRGGSEQSLALAGTYVMGTVVGGVAGRLIPAVAVSAWGWTAGFMTFAALHVVVLVVVAALDQTTTATAVAAIDGRASRSGRRNSIALGLAGFALLFAQSAVMTYVAVRLASSPYAWTGASLGLLYLVFLPSLLFLQPARRAVSMWGARTMFGLAATTTWLGLALTMAQMEAIIVCGLMVFAVGVFVGQSLLAHEVSRATQRDGAASGTYLCLYYLGGSAGAIAPALGWDASGWTGLVVVIAALHVTALIVVRAVAKSIRTLDRSNDEVVGL